MARLFRASACVAVCDNAVQWLHPLERALSLAPSNRDWSYRLRTRDRTRVYCGLGLSKDASVSFAGLARKNDTGLFRERATSPDSCGSERRVPCGVVWHSDFPASYDDKLMLALNSCTQLC